MNVPILNPDKSAHRDRLFPTDKGRGLIPRDYAKYPVGYLKCAPPAEIKLIPRSEWSARIKERAERKAGLANLRMTALNGQPIPSLNQGQWGYCWAHSTTGALMLVRAKMGLPYVPLSAFAVAATIKNGQDEGGWGALSLQFAEERGIPSQQFWPQGSADLSHGTPECWADAAQHKVTDDWADLQTPVYNRNLTIDQYATLLLSDVPVVSDFNWWGHSVCAIDWVEIEPGSFGPKILNSWGDDWEDHGMANLEGDKGIPDGAVAPRNTLAS